MGRPESAGGASSGAPGSVPAAQEAGLAGHGDAAGDHVGAHAHCFHPTYGPGTTPQSADWCTASLTRGGLNVGFARALGGSSGRNPGKATAPPMRSCTFVAQ